MKERSQNIARILKLKAKIETDIDLLSFVGSVPTGKDFEDLLACFRRLLPKTIASYVVDESLASLAGQTITPAILAETAWRLAGNLTRLSRGFVVPPWTHQVRREWVPVHVNGARQELSGRGTPLVRYSGVVLAGSPASLRFDKVWPQRFLPIIAGHIGFTRMRGEYPYQHFRQFIGLRLRVLFDPALSENRPVFDKVDDKQPSNILRWNRSLLSWRARKTWRCPKDYRLPEHPCHLCPVGLEDCLAAVHPKTYVIRSCLRCKRNKFHDPAGRSKICLDCEYRKMLEQHGGAGDG